MEDSVIGSEAFDRFLSTVSLWILKSSQKITGDVLAKEKGKGKRKKRKKENLE